MGKNKNAIIGDKSVTIEGNISCNSNVVIGAIVKGNIVSQDADSCIVITGEIYGDITTTGNIEVLAGAVINGNMTCKTIIADAGAIINGMVKTNCDTSSEYLDCNDVVMG